MAVPRLPYQHGFHAGNFADLAKHSVLVLLLQHMRLKKTPFAFVDTHAGAGEYDLASSEASQLSEARGGVRRLQSARAADTPPCAAALLQLMAQRQAETGSELYPGSPLIAQRLTRPQDSLILCENAPEQHARLAANVGADSRATVLLDDGYKAVQRREVATPQRRALVFVDPPYQLGSDTERCAQLVRHLRTHWRSARVCIWFPVRRTGAHRTERLYDAVLAAGDADCLAAEVGGGGDAVGTGLLLVQPPYGLDAELRTLLPHLASLAQPADDAAVSVEWLRRS